MNMLRNCVKPKDESYLFLGKLISFSVVIESYHVAQAAYAWPHTEKYHVESGYVATGE